MVLQNHEQFSKFTTSQVILITPVYYLMAIIVEMGTYCSPSSVILVIAMKCDG